MIIRGNVAELCKQIHLAYVNCKCKIAFGERLTTFLQIFLHYPSDPEAQDHAKSQVIKKNGRTAAHESNRHQLTELRADSDSSYRCEQK